MKLKLLKKIRIRIKILIRVRMIREGLNLGKKKYKNMI